VPALLFRAPARAAERRRRGNLIPRNVGQANGGVQLETMIGIAALLVGAGVAWLCFAAGVYFFTRTGREGMRIARMEEEQRHRPPRET
jgi:hypothetical protein